MACNHSSCTNLTSSTRRDPCHPGLSELKKSTWTSEREYYCTYSSSHQSTHHTPSKLYFDNAISLLSIDICDYISKLYSKECVNLVCVSFKSSFSYNVLMDKYKNNV